MLALAPVITGPSVFERADRLRADHGRMSRVVLRRLRWAGLIDRATYWAVDARLAALRVPARLQMDLLGAADAAL